MVYAYLDDLKLAYLCKGNGFPIIFIHGYGGNKEFWNPQMIEISKYYKTISLDIRGTGESDRPNFPYTMTMLANDIKELMNYLHITKAHIIGRSFGGMIAQNVVLTYPNLVDKLILIATNYGRLTPEWADLIKDNTLQRIELLKKDPNQAFKQEARIVFDVNFRKKMEHNPNKKFFDLFSMNDLIANSTINPPRTQDIKNQAEAMKTHYTLERLSEITHQTLLIAASHDRLIPISVMQEIHNRIPNSVLRIIQDAGHFMTLSHASEVNKLILEFLKKS